jgi:nitroreductase
MEVMQVLGNRRSIRYYLPHRPVEREKVQKMLEAARRASCVGNVTVARAVVIWKDQASEELIKAITPPLGYQQMNTAPCFILWYHDKLSYEGDKWIEDLKGLATQRRIGENMEQTVEVIEKSLRPAFGAAWEQMAVAPLAFMDVGQVVAQATFAAWDQGLATCLMSSPRLEQIGPLLNLPETAIPVCLMSVGYPAESWEAGGQTSRPPLEDIFFEMQYGTSFKSDPAVVEELKDAGLIQTPAPLPWREAELKYIAHALDMEFQLAIPGAAKSNGGGSQ